MDNGTALMLSSIRRTSQRLWNDAKISAPEKRGFSERFQANSDDMHYLHAMNKEIAALITQRTPLHQRPPQAA